MNRLIYWPKKILAALGVQRVVSVLRSRFNPLRGFDPEKLVAAIESWHAGYIAPLALIVEALEERDDTWRTAARKTKSAVSRCGHQIMIRDGHENDPAAKRHKATLEAFWASITVTDAFRRDQLGGRSLLVRQMMDAYGTGYAVHEIVWQPHPDGSLSAEFIRVPLWMCENTTGRLRYLPDDTSIWGIDMPDGEWLVTVADGVGIAAAVACMSKRLCMEDWLLYSERCGQPGLHATTPAKQGSDEWNSLLTSIRNYGREWNLLSNPDVKLNPVQMSAAGTLPYPEFVARMDKAIAALWRGADLSTLSAGANADGTGASLQGGESDLLEQDACELISETLARQVERHVIRYVHGDAEPLAGIQILPEARPDLKQEMEIDAHLAAHGVRLSRNEALRRYQRAECDAADTSDAPLLPAPQPGALPAAHGTPPAPGAEPAAAVQDTALNGAQVQSMVAILSAAASGSLPQASVMPMLRAAFPAIPPATLEGIVRPLYGFEASSALANEALAGNKSGAAAALAANTDAKLSASAREAILKALDADLQPLRDRIAQALQAPDDKLQDELQKVLADIPGEIFAKVAASGKLDAALADTITASLFNGLAAEAAKRSTP